MQGFIEYDLPFCAPFVCSGPHPKTYSFFSEVILWQCMPQPCRRNVQAMISLICMLSVFTTFFNLVVIGANLMPSSRRVLRRSPTMQNYSNYVISLALADLLIGVVVMPLAVVFFYQEAYASRVVAAMNRTLVGGWSVTNQTSSNSISHFPLRYLSHVYSSTFENTGNGSQPKPGSKTNDSEVLLHFLGFFMHFSILVSVYTLAAASADRFYVSTKPSRSRGIRLSRVSLRRLSVHRTCTPESCLSMGASRSTLIVFSIWMIGLLLALSPFYLPNNRYQHVGHVFATVVASDSSSTMFVWYIAALVLPLAVIWVFSSLLWLTLWRRKRRLKRFSRSVSKQELQEKKSLEKEAESSYAFVSRGSNPSAALGSHVGSSSSSDNNTTSRDSTILEAASSKDADLGVSAFNEVRPKPKLSQSVSLPCSRRHRRPSSFDSSLIVSRLDDNENEENKEEQQKQQKRFLKCYSAEGSLPPGYVAKRILLRRSWEGPSSDSMNLSQSSISKTPAMSECSVASKSSVVSPPTTPSPSSGRRSASGRRIRMTPSRVRRQSSLFRARDFIMSNSFESNIARTLFAVVVVFTIAISPLLVVMLQLAPTERASLEKRNKDLTSLVVAVAILLSNSFWNCFIYGVRMPYFRTAVMRIFRKSIRWCRDASCTHLLARKISLNNSLRRNSEISEAV